MQSRFMSLWFVALSFLIVACDTAPPGLSQAHEDKPTGHRFGGIPVDDKDSSIKKPNFFDQYDIDVPALEQRAASGDANAQYDLGEVYRTGNTVTADFAKAVAWFEKAAEQGHAEAQFILGEMYENGDGISKDLAKAIEWYEKAAAQPVPDIKVESLKPWERDWDDGEFFSARSPQAKAQFRLGVIYDTGEGVPQDQSKAVMWYEKAAEQGVAGAQFILGKMYDNGEGVPKDAAKAAGWFEKAAKQGDAFAQYLLGWRYAKGEGVPKNAAKAAEWHQKAADQGLAEAQFVMGRMYFNGDGVTKDAAIAVEWFLKAAAQGDTSAQFILGHMYRKGDGVPKDGAKAVEWFQKAAAQGDVRAQSNLSAVYLLGEDVPRDRVLSYAWANVAAAQGSEAAKERRDTAKLSSAQRAEAERLSSNWKKGQVLRRETEGSNATTAPDEAVPGGVLKKTATGTLFVVSTQGQSITNAHVVKDCAELRIESREGLATVMTTDAVNDLALIQIPGTVTFAAPIAKEPGKIRQGEDVVVFGFPLNAVLSSGGNLTPGVVSAMTGLGNNSNQIQITAPIQPGSSGSPVLNKKGEVVGVVSMKLSDVKMAAATGSVAQNVNFAVSGQTLKAFLDAHEVNYKNGAGFFPLEKNSAELADEARKWTLVVECWK